MYEPYEMNEKEKKIPKEIQISLGIAISCLLSSLFLLLFNNIMNPEGIYLRTWAGLLGRGISCLGLPASIGICVWQVFRYKEKAGKIRKGSTAVAVGKLVFLTVYIIILIAMTFFMIVSLLFAEKETKAANGFLAGDMVYYEEYTWLLKKRYVPTFEWVSREMEKQYQITVENAEGNSPQTGFQKYTLQTEGEDGLLTFHVYPGPFLDFPNDYIQVKANQIIRAKAGEICPTRPLTDLREEGFIRAQKVTGISLPCYGRKDVEECSRIAAELVNEVQKDPLFKEEGAKLVVECQGGDYYGKNIVIPIGKYGNNDKYTDWSIICLSLLENYEKHEKQDINEEVNDPDAEETLKGENYEESAFYIEGAYKALYEKLFAPEGYYYETSYNAKGNFYAYLATGGGMLESTEGTFKTVETVVYDRISKNEKCHLFVHYIDYYRDGEQTVYTTKIVNMYAVDMGTGEVYISDRHAWADVGTKEYCEATGEP